GTGGLLDAAYHFAPRAAAAPLRCRPHAQLTGSRARAARAALARVSGRRLAAAARRLPRGPRLALRAGAHERVPLGARPRTVAAVLEREPVRGLRLAGLSVLRAALLGGGNDRRRARGLGDARLDGAARRDLAALDPADARLPRCAARAGGRRRRGGGTD